MLKKTLNILARYWVILFLSWMTFMYWFAVQFELGLNLKLLIIIWTGVTIFVRVGGFLKIIPVRLSKLWIVSVFIYPLVETVIRIYIAKEIIAYSWRYFNTAEHFFWMMFLLVISYPLFYNVLQKLNGLHRFLHLFGFLMIVGIFNELFEFVMRIRNLVPPEKLAYYYKDTIYDLSINIPGVIAGMILVYFFDKGRKQNEDFKRDEDSEKEARNEESLLKPFQENKFLRNVFQKHPTSFLNNKFFRLIKKPFGNKWFKRIFILGVAGFVFLIGVNFYILKSTQDQIYFNQNELPEYQVALLLGAKVYDNGVLSPIMKDRTDVAIEIYNLGKVKKILVSGDHGTNGYDEVNAIKNYLLEKGVDKKDIFLDHAGFDTYDSVYRAKNIFEVESMIIVTQKFHLPRAVYISNSLGVESVGIVADRRYIFLRNYLRESVSRVKAFLNVMFGAEPKFLGDVILITGDSEESWD